MNWYFTQAISYCDAEELIVNASVRFSGCDTNSFNEGDRVNPENYHYYLDTPLASCLSQAQDSGDTQTLKSFLQPCDASHTYTLAFKTLAHAVGQVQHFMVYYKVCQNNQVGLEMYPEVPLLPQAGSDGQTMRLARCVPHAHNITSLETYAISDRCEQAVSCECDAGYELSKDSTEFIRK